MSLTFHNMRRRLAAQKAKENAEKPVENQAAPADKPKKGKVKKGE